MTQPTMAQNKSEKAAKRPVHTIRYGAIRAAIWRNVVDSGNTSRPMYNVTFSRCYKDGERWRNTTTFGVDDLLVVAKVANEIHTYIYQVRRHEDTPNSV
ncbi:MAG: hypothetical protein ABSB74_04125 [Tepidisphaeraceae bacterium]